MNGSRNAGLPIIVGIVLFVGVFMISSSPGWSVQNGPTVQVSVSASDPSGNPLRYRWKASDGVVVNVNAPTTKWTLPPGPGLHFLYVLVSNKKGGYTERRIAVNNDTIGAPAVMLPPRTLAAPPAAVPQGNIFRSFISWGRISSTIDRLVLVPDIPVYLQYGTNGPRYPATGTVRTNRMGEFVISGVPPGDQYTTKCSVDSGATFSDCSGYGPREMPLMAATDYIVGSTSTDAISGTLSLEDGTPPGTLNEFFGLNVAATATLLDSAGRKLAGPVRLNERGDYSLPFRARAASVLLRCELATPVKVPVTNLGGLISVAPAVLSGVSAPVVTSMSATLNGTEVGIFLPPPAGLPSDIVTRANSFLAEKGLDSRISACQYYKSVGAVKSCSATGIPSGAISFEDWKRAVKIGPYATPGPTEYTATYINKMDLNLTRNHHSISYGPDQTAAYVCNHLGPPSPNPTQDEIDVTIDNAVNGKNLVACVAMDHSVTPGVNNGQAFTRFLIFGPSGKLLQSVNLDGRREKFVPGTCVVCHGGDFYAGKFNQNGRRTANIGAHFLPYDTGNFDFSSKAGLREADQEESIYQLNQNVLKAGPTLAAQELISGWYATSHVLDKNYLPASWQLQSADAISFYHKVLAPSCRSCHVAMVEGYNFDHYQNIDPLGPFYRGGDAVIDVRRNVCGGEAPAQINRNFMMPNSLVTFNRFWQSVGTLADQPSLLAIIYTNGSHFGPCTNP